MLGANGQPLPTCIAWHCKVHIQPPHPFCKAHWLRIPNHIRQCLLAERHELLKQKSTDPTPHFLQLLNIAVEKELQRRMKEDPKVAELVQKEADELAAKMRAAQSPILDSKAQPQLSPSAPPLPPALQVRP